MNLQMLSILSGATAAVSLIVCVVSACIHNAREARPRVGDVWVHSNPGTAITPEEPQPFVLLRTVLEVDEANDRIKVGTRRIGASGDVREYEAWQRLYEWGRFDERIYRHPATTVTEFSVEIEYEHDQPKEILP